MDRGAWWATVHGVAESRTRLNDNCIIALWALSYYLAQSDIPLWNPSSGISRYSKEPWFLQLRVVFKSWDLGAKCAHCFWGATASRCGQSWGICVSTFMYVHTNIRIYLCLCLYSYIYIYDKMSSHWHYKFQHHRIHVIFFSLICNLLFCQWETWIPFPLISVYVCSWSPTSDFPLTPSSSHLGSENPSRAVLPTRHPPHPHWALGHCPEPPWLPPTLLCPRCWL